ncbi:hypothetical protein PF003_g17581 [Phytophthora fragariae]|nr:hypothetical protein PF003_g17581 [Phytophthora fragariae]
MSGSEVAPPLDRAAQKEKAKQALKEYNNGTNLRTLLREKDVCEVLATLHDVKPGIREVGSFLATLQVKSQGQGKPIEWRVDAEFVPDTVRFRLLESVVDSALEQLRGGLAKSEQIELDSDGEAAAGAYRYVAAIAKFGQFTRAQVEAMKWLWNLQATCRDAVICCSWLHREVRAAHAPPSPCAGAFTELLENRPYNELRGFGFDLTYSDLYCFHDSAWLNDDAIKAFAVVLANYENNVTITATPQGHGEATQKKRSRKGLLSSKTLEDVVAGASTHAFVLLPVNFGGTHWGCLVVDQDTKQVKTYDSKNGKRNKQRLKKIASEIIAADSTTASYTTVEVAEPLQSDSDSCGVFVCPFFWTCVSDDAPSDVTPTGITKLRWAMLEAILKMKRR